MDRRLSNVQIQQQMRRDSDSRSRCRDNGYSPSRLQRDPRQGRGVVKQQPRSRSSYAEPVDNINNSCSNNNNHNINNNSNNNNNSYNCRGYSRNFPGFTDSYWRGQAANQKRRRPTLWETLAGLVCSLGALASRAAKMAARRSDML